MGLNATLGINTNIAKLQLGCGGVNDALNASIPCDIDIDYMSMMGTSGGPDSEFTLQRPYIGLAIKNDGSPTSRQVVGIKVGAQSVTGLVSAGRVYNNGQYNQENGTKNYTTNGTLNDWNNVPSGAGNATGYYPQCNTGASYGNAVLFCNSGINSLSGFVGAELSLQTYLDATCVQLIICLELTIRGCAGRLTPNPGSACNHTNNNPLFVDVSGTRMTALKLSAVKLDFKGTGTAALMNALGITAVYASLNANLRLLHQFSVNNTSDFFLSFQAEPVAWPRFTKQAAYLDVPTGNPYYDECGYTTTGRCGSAYAVAANTGWWMNVPNAKLLNVNPGTLTVTDTLSIGDALGLLNAPGLWVDNPSLNVLPVQNCRGSAFFC
jgi:hypothetical protein